MSCRHTNGHICFLCREEGSTAAVFTGDTLFVGGCGRRAQPQSRAFGPGATYLRACVVFVKLAQRCLPAALRRMSAKAHGFLLV